MNIATKWVFLLAKLFCCSLNNQYMNARLETCRCQFLKQMRVFMRHFSAEWRICAWWRQLLLWGHQKQFVSIYITNVYLWKWCFRSVDLHCSHEERFCRWILAWNICTNDSFAEMRKITGQVQLNNEKEMNFHMNRFFDVYAWSYIIGHFLLVTDDFMKLQPVIYIVFSKAKQM